MIAKSLDIVVLLKLVLDESLATYALLGQALGISASEAHASVKRSIHAGLLGPDRVPNRKAIEEYLIHGVRHAFPALRGAVVRGIPTSFAAPPLSERIEASDDLIPVWPDSEGTVRGYSIKPLYSSVPFAAKRDARLYELLALVDALREGRARERKLAEEELRNRLAYAYAA